MGTATPVEQARLRDPFAAAVPRAPSGGQALRPALEPTKPDIAPSPRQASSQFQRSSRESSSSFDTMQRTPAPSGFRESDSGWSAGNEPSASFDLGGREPSSQVAMARPRRSGWSGITQGGGGSSSQLSVAASSSSAQVDPTVRPQDADAQQAFAALFPREPIREVEAAQLAAICTRQYAAPGHVLSAKGHPAEIGYIIANGFARLELASDNHPMGAAALRVGDWAGDAVLSGEETHLHDVVAASDVVLFACERADLLDLAQRMPALAAHLAAAVTEQSMRRSKLQLGKMNQIAQAALGLTAADPEPTSSEGSSITRLFSRLTGKGG